VSLSGVEERDGEEDDASYAQSQDEVSVYTSQPGDETIRTDVHEHEHYDDSLLGDDADISGSTPRARPTTASSDKSKFADYSSQYEALKQELRGSAKEHENENGTQVIPTTPGRQEQIPDMSMTPQSSPFDATSYPRSATQRKADPLLHRVLDKAYRIQATPHTARKENKTPSNKPSWRDTTSPMSSPPVAAPQLRSEIFSSPIRQQYNPNAPRTPGVSVQTPAKGKGKDIFSKPAKKDEISWESDSDEDAEGVYNQLGMSPPKTIQFNLPQSRLLQTPGMWSFQSFVHY
jgi:DASH complex subunit ASK1